MSKLFFSIVCKCRQFAFQLIVVALGLLFPAREFFLQSSTEFLQRKQPLYKRYPFSGSRIHELRKLPLRKSYALSEILFVYAYNFGYAVIHALDVVSNGNGRAVRPDFIEHSFVNFTLSLYAALYNVSSAHTVRKNIKGKADAEFVAPEIDFIYFIGIALYVAVQRKIYGVEYCAFTASGFTEYSEDSALQQRSKIYFRLFRKAVESLKLQIDRLHSSSVSDRKSSSNSCGAGEPNRDV